MNCKVLVRDLLDELGVYLVVSHLEAIELLPEARMIYGSALGLARQCLADVIELRGGRVHLRCKASSLAQRSRLSEMSGRKGAEGARTKSGLRRSSRGSFMEAAGRMSASDSTP